MSNKKKVYSNMDNCPECGNGIYITTDSTKKDYFYDGDKVECGSCNEKGMFSTDGEYSYIQWEVNQ